MGRDARAGMAVDDLLTVKLDGRLVPTTAIVDPHHSRQHLLHVDRAHSPSRTAAP
jgi:hypothetical protein